MHFIFLGWFYFDNLEEKLVSLLQFIVKFWFFFYSKSEPTIQMFFFSVQHKNQQVRVYSKPQIYSGDPGYMWSFQSVSGGINR